MLDEPQKQNNINRSQLNNNDYTITIFIDSHFPFFTLFISPKIICKSENKCKTYQQKVNLFSESAGTMVYFMQNRFCQVILLVYFC